MPARPKRSPGEGFLAPRLIFAIRLLTAGAIVVACYLVWASLSGSAVAGCGPDSGCDQVLHSRWAYWFGIPVSGIALLVYGTIFTVTFWLGLKSPPLLQRKAWAVLI